MSIHILGIRHHGPMSALRVKEELEHIKPDLILLEGPPEADDLVKFVAAKKMVPPVAVMAYQIGNPKNAVFYPFAKFSPEWQAMRYAQKHDVKLNFFDLPLVHKLAIYEQEQAKKEAELEALLQKEATSEDEQNKEQSTQLEQKTTEQSDTSNPSHITDTDADTNPDADAGADASEELVDNEPSSEDEDFADPMAYYAQIDGLSSGEEWWDSVFEHRHDNTDAFAAITLAMSAYREEFASKVSKRDLLREAYMRKMLRAAMKDGAQVIAVICGAFHAPALVDLEKYKVKDDNALLKGLPKCKVDLTFIPWTYSRLSYTSGYGAGINSPGYYEHIFKHPQDDGTLWLTKAAQVLRKAKFDISSAHVIESVRLALTLAALRNRPHATLQDLNEAVITVMGFGSDIMLKVVHNKLIVGSKIGSVPANVPKVPLIADLESNQKKLRLPFSDTEQTLILDLRKELDLNRSTFLHRLVLLNMPWGKKQYAGGKGTFKEQWNLSYKPEMLIDLIEKAIFGNTVEIAAIAYSSEILQSSSKISDLTQLLSKAIPADLPELCNTITKRIDDLAASGSDVVELMLSIAPLCEIVRYGSVRKLDFSAIEDMLKTMLERILANGILACVNIADDVAENMQQALNNVNEALLVLNREDYTDIFLQLLHSIHTTSKVHPLLSGTATRILKQNGNLSTQQIVDSMSYYTSSSNTPTDMAFYLQGFLQSSGLLIVLDEALWAIVYTFITRLDNEQFANILPMLRRTFSEFSNNERKQIGQKAQEAARQGMNLEKIQNAFAADASLAHGSDDDTFHNEHALKATSLLMSLICRK